MSIVEFTKERAYAEKDSKLFIYNALPLYALVDLLEQIRQ